MSRGLLWGARDVLESTDCDRRGYRMSPEIESSGTVSKPGLKEHLECGRSSLTSCHDRPRVLRRRRRLHVCGGVCVQTWFLNVPTRTRRAWPSGFVAGSPDKACPLKDASTGPSQG